LKRQVAIKKLSPTLIENRDQLHRFRQEALFAAVLNHPNICTIYEAGEVNGTTFIAMEHVEGETLRHYVVSHRISLAEILDYATQIADALKEAHQKNVIHRDIKTSNIILTPRKTVKILDFGLAKQIARLNQENFSEASTDFSSGVGASPRGTTPYMSPEGLLGKKVDQRSDLFSFGVVLYEMLTGQLPFKGASNMEVVDAILHGEPTSVTRYNDSVPDPMLRVLKKLLEKDPEMRYQSAHEVWSDLRRLKEESTRPDTLPPWVHPLPPPTRKNDFLIKAGLTFLIAIIALATAFFYFKRSKTSYPSAQNVNAPKTIAILPFHYTGDPSHKYLRNMVADALIASMESEPGVSVAPFTSVINIEPEEEPQEIAKKLGVQWIIRGEVSSNNSIISIRPEVVTAKGEKIWNQSINATEETIIPTLSSTKNVLISELKFSEKSSGKDVGQLRTPVAEAYKLYIQARALQEEWDAEQNISEATNLYRKALEIDPDSAATHAGLAKALLTEYVKTRSPALLAEAKSEAQKSLTLDADLPEVQLAVGLIKLQTGNSVEAKLAFARAVELSPGNDAACRQIGLVYEVAGRFQEAKEIYEKAIELRPSYWSNHYSLGVLYFAGIGDFKKARPPLLKATELSPQSPSPKVVLGLVELFRGDIDSADKLFRSVLENGPNVYAQNGIGLVYFYKGKYELAHRTFEKLLNDLPDQVIYKINLADNLKWMGKNDEARQKYVSAMNDFRALLASNIEDNQSRAGLALALSAIGECKEAKKEMSAVLAKQNTPEFAGYAMLTASRCGDKEEAKRIILDQMKIDNVVDIKYHPDLAVLRDDPEIKKTLAKLESGSER
jgi:serine/threonine-protein kinase